MKKLYFLFFLTIGFLANAQVINFTDTTFKNLLLGYGIAKDINGNTISINVNNNGEIEVNEALLVYEMIIPQNNNIPKITSLVGIEYFTNLKKIICDEQNIANINISQLINLEYIYITYSNLQQINLSNLSNLKSLNLNFNVLSSLDLSTLNNLEYMYCDVNQITNLDFTNLILLKKIGCSANNLTSIQVTNLPQLTELICNDNSIQNLNLNGLISLDNLNCSSNQISTINYGNASNINTLNLSSNQLNSFALSNLSNLEFLYLSNNNLSSVNFTGPNILKGLELSNNDLTTIDVSNLNQLTLLNIDNNNLTDINLANNILLSYFDCSANQFDEVDVSKQINLFNFKCIDNLNLEYINFKNGATYNNFYTLSNLPNIKYACVDEDELWDIYYKLYYYSGVTEFEVNSYCSFTPGGTFYDILVTAKFDSNNNGCDISDINYSNLNFSITDGINSGTFIANQSGSYFMPVQEGTHTITPNLENSTYFNISPTSFIVDFPTQASPFTQDFCVSANGVHSDVEIVLIPTTAARPGFDSTYKLVYHNKGNQVENGSIVFSMHNQTVVDFVSSVPNFDSQTVTSIVEKFTWNYSNLLPFETREIEIVVNLNSPLETPALNAGDLLSFDAQILISNMDEYIIDNFFAIRQEVVNSFDPNYKTCLQGETIEPSEVGNYVHYVIRFENTGTFAAENIVVRDMIDLDKFDISTLVPLHSSHDFSTRINGDRVEFIFENINLDFNDATNDGHVVFKIKTKSTLVVGNTFSNNVNIYFDYNFPITTNTYTTEVQTLSTQDFDFGTYFILYPNPTNEVLNIKAKQELNLNSLEIYNQLGQIVMVVTNAVHAIDVSNLASGTYFVKINTEKGNATTKFVKQ